MITSCVSRGKYLVLSSKANDLRKINTELRKSKLKLTNQKNSITNEIAAKNKIIQSKAFEINKYITDLDIESQIEAEDLKDLNLNFEYSKRTEKYKTSEIKRNIIDVARKTSWLSSIEKDAYYYLNYARVYPAEFCDAYIIPIYKENPTDVYLATLIVLMKEMAPLDPINPDKTLFDEAKCHATTSGKQGIIGHSRISTQCTSSFMGECISYGNGSGLDHVVRLLIDRNVESLGHRYICLSEGYKICGISKAYHSTYNECLVLDFK